MREIIAAAGAAAAVCAAMALMFGSVNTRLDAIDARLVDVERRVAHTETMVELLTDRVLPYGGAPARFDDSACGGAQAVAIGPAPAGQLTPDREQSERAPPADAAPPIGRQIVTGADGGLYRLADETDNCGTGWVRVDPGEVPDLERRGYVVVPEEAR